ncbi:MAG: hypothetical protein K2N38_01125 [Oscillospiraceae bacterium]|nr:hypothetical protein [Oscillospiraceae bacterium]
MYIADNIIKNRLTKVYFVWGRGKTTISNKLRDKYGFYVYSTDDSRDRHRKAANPVHQPYMCYDFEKEFCVKDFWELPCKVIGEREKHFLAEMTPMIIADLMILSETHDVIICEGDIDYETVIPVAAHTVHLCNRGTKFDFFNRPDHENLDSIRKRSDLSETEKENIIQNAYNSVGRNEGIIPEWVIKNGVKNIMWDDTTSIEQTASEVEEYFGFSAVC